MLLKVPYLFYPSSSILLSCLSMSSSVVSSRISILTHLAKLTTTRSRSSPPSLVLPQPMTVSLLLHSLPHLSNNKTTIYIYAVLKCAKAVKEQVEKSGLHNAQLIHLKNKPDGISFSPSFLFYLLAAYHLSALPLFFHRLCNLFSFSSSSSGS